MGLNEEIGNALERVRTVSLSRGGNIVQSNEISRRDRELLLRVHWLQPIIRGWYMLVKPELMPGESSHWYANFWRFVGAYLENLYAKEYCLGAESSLDIHTDSSTIPKQVIVIVPKGGGVAIDLPFQTSIFPYKDPKNFPENRSEKKNLQVMDLGYALCKVAPTFFELYPQRAEIALRLIQSSDQLLGPIIEYGFKNAAARLMGAYKFLGDDRMANQLNSGLERVGVILKPENPFVHPKPMTSVRVRSPYIARITSMWKSYRDVVIEHFPNPPGMSKNIKECLFSIEETYKRDAYNSLSIEGFDVDEELIVRVKNDQWNPEQSLQDQEKRNALAARGYYEAFVEVENSIKKILKGDNPGKIVEEDLSEWYQNLFAPSVRAGLLKPTDLLGYRKSAVYIRNSRHIPLSKESLFDAMEALFSCIREEEHSAVRAVLGHFLFVYIHPYMDGNGRIGRFLMNTMLISGGYPWTIIQLENRREYLASLEKASTDHEIIQFIKFIAKEMKKQ
jgi:Fic family protein